MVESTKKSVEEIAKIFLAKIIQAAGRDTNFKKTLDCIIENKFSTNPDLKTKTTRLLNDIQQSIGKKGFISRFPFKYTFASETKKIKGVMNLLLCKDPDEVSSRLKTRKKFSFGKKPRKITEKVSENTTESSLKTTGP
jgi:hypothetical protein